MSNDDVEAVREGALAFEVGDLDAALQNLDPEAEFVVLSTPGAEGRTYRGVPGARAAIRDLIGRVEGYSARIHRYVEAPDGRVVVLAVHGGYDVDLGRQVMRSTGSVITSRDGAAVRIEVYPNWVQALEAAGADPALADEEEQAAALRQDPRGDGPGA